jgi:hypothetical protein
MADEIEEVTITCSAGDQGNCFKKHNYMVQCYNGTIMGIPQYYYWGNDCDWTGLQNDYCEKNNDCPDV